MSGFYYHFNNLRFNKSQSIKGCSAAHVVASFVSSEPLNCRSLKFSLDCPMSYTRSGTPRSLTARPWRRAARRSERPRGRAAPRVLTIQHNTI